MVRSVITLSIKDNKAKEVIADIEKNYPHGKLSQIFSSAVLEFGGQGDTIESLEKRFNELIDEEKTIQKAKNSVQEKIERLKRIESEHKEKQKLLGETEAKENDKWEKKFALAKKKDELRVVFRKYANESGIKYTNDNFENWLKENNSLSLEAK